MIRIFEKIKYGEGSLLKLRNSLMLEDNKKELRKVIIDTEFRIENIVGYGIDLVSRDGAFRVRVLNSEIDEHFIIVENIAFKASEENYKELKDQGMLQVQIIKELNSKYGSKVKIGEKYFCSMQHEDVRLFDVQTFEKVISLNKMELEEYFSIVHL